MREEKEMNAAPLINTLLQRGDGTTDGRQNRFNGFSRQVETVETVSVRLCAWNTSLKQGVNETWCLNDLAGSTI
ncbi:MAG: hypothetical protein ACLP2Y_07730 [Limisphaerales bacterium]